MGCCGEPAGIARSSSMLITRLPALTRPTAQTLNRCLCSGYALAEVCVEGFNSSEVGEWLTHRRGSLYDSL